MYLQMLGDYSTLPIDLLEHVKNRTVIWDLLRTLGYTILKAIAKLIDGTYAAVNKLLSIDLYTIIKNNFPDFFNAIPSIVWVAFGLAMMIGGVLLAKNRNKGKASEFFENILIASLLIVALPFFINSLSDLKTAGVNDVDNLSIGGSADTIGDNILSSITIDVDASKDGMKYISDQSYVSAYTLNINEILDNKGFWDRKLVSKNSTSKKSPITEYALYKDFFKVSEKTARSIYLEIKYFNTNGLAIESLKDEIIADVAANQTDEEKKNQVLSCKSLNELLLLFSSEISEWTKEYLKTPEGIYISSYKTEFLTDEDEYEEMSWNDQILENIKTLGSPVENIYAYDFFFINGLFVLIITLVALIFGGLKIAKLMYELVFNQLIAPLVFATDLNNSGRRKKIIQELVSTVLVFIIILFIIKMFLVVVLYVIKSNFSIAVQILLLLGGMAFVIDGPDTVVKLIGMDAGVKSGSHALMAASSGINMAKGAAGSMAKTGKAAGKSAVDIGSQGLSSAGKVGKALLKTPSNVVKGAKSGAKMGASLGKPGSVAGGILGGAAGAIKGAGGVAKEGVKTAGSVGKGVANVLTGGRAGTTGAAGKLKTQAADVKNKIADGSSTSAGRNIGRNISGLDKNQNNKAEAPTSQGTSSELQNQQAEAPDSTISSSENKNNQSGVIILTDDSAIKSHNKQAESTSTAHEIKQSGVLMLTDSSATKSQNRQVEAPNNVIDID